MIGFGNPQQHADFEIASFSRCRNIKGQLQILGSSPRLGPQPLFLLVGSDDGLWQIQVHAKFEVAGLTEFITEI